MIYIDRIITILNNEATIEQPIVLYKGDKNVQLLFSLKDNYLKYKSMENAYGQLIIKRPTANPIFSEQARLSSSKVTFIVTKEMIDELVECGNYEFQIRLFNQDKSSRATLPPIKDGIIIREPILEEDVPNEVGVATVNETQVMAEDTELEVFDEEGNYNKTTWSNGDIITDVKLNKIEEAIYEINEKEVEVDLSTLATKEELNEYATKDELNEGLETKSDLEHIHEEYAPIDYPKFTSASSRTLTVGQYNEKDVLGDYIFIAGNGTEYSKKTVYKLSKEGHGYYEKGVTIGQPPTTNNEVTNKSYVDSGLNKKADKDHTHNYLTEKDISGKADKTDLHEHTNKTVLDGITQEKVREWNNKSDFSGNYDNLSNKPYIPSIEGLASEEYVDEKVGELETYVDEKVGEIIVPTKVSELENDSNFATQTFVSDAINKAQFEGNDSIDLSIYAKLEDLHEHENKTILDGITEEKVAEWDNKVETNNPTFTGSVKIQGEESLNVNGVGLAIGEFAEANKSSLAVGSGTATGENSVAFGTGVITNHYNQFVHGQGNIEDDYYETNGNYSFSMGKYAHIVGNGWFDNETFEWVRSNAYTLDWYGNGWYQGKLTIEGTPTEEKDVTTKLYVDTLVSTKANEEHTHEKLATKEEIPTKVSQLENDNNYLTEVPSEYITETELNNKGYLTRHQDISHLALKTELHEHENKTILDNITEEKINTWNNKSEFDGDYNSLTNKPTIPSIEGLATEEYVDNAIENIEIKDELTTLISGTVGVNLTTDKYQYVDMTNTIIPSFTLPTVTEFTEIHVFFDLNVDYEGVFGGVNGATVKYQGGYEDFKTFFDEYTTYEIIATYIPNANYWLIGAVKYTS